MTFGEDQCRIRKDHAPQNIATLRQDGPQSAQERNQPEGGHPGEIPPSGLERGLPLKVLRIKTRLPWIGRCSTDRLYSVLRYNGSEGQFSEHTKVA